MSSGLYVDTSAVLRAVLEQGTSPEVESRLKGAAILVTSRLSLVESARALLRVRSNGLLGEERLTDVEREVAEVWARCELWEITRAVCDLAAQVAPRSSLRALDSLHLATFLLARRRLARLELLSTDGRLQRAAKEV